MMLECVFVAEQVDRLVKEGTNQLTKEGTNRLAKEETNQLAKEGTNQLAKEGTIKSEPDPKLQVSFVLKHTHSHWKFLPWTTQCLIQPAVVRRMN